MKYLHYRPLWIATLAALMLIAGIISGGCGTKKKASQPKAVVPVTVDTAQSMDVPIELREIGSVEAFNTVAVTARIGGQLLYVGFKEGQEVKKGDLLFRIDPGPYEA